MKLTKNDMARVITQALLNMPHLPPKDHHWVKKEERPAKQHVAERYTLAHKILADRVAKKAKTTRDILRLAETL